jgi:hypothetical protein
MFNNQVVTSRNIPEQHQAGRGQYIQTFMILGFVMMLSACGNDTENIENLEKQTNNQKYNGPGPNTPDIQNFKREFWAKLNDTENCGGCHDIGGTGTTKFVRTDNVNDAYFEALTLVNVNDIPASSIVTKMADGHNCWLGTNQDCADAIVSYIESWQLSESTAIAGQIDLDAPVLNDAGATKTFTASARDNGTNSFEQTVYPLLIANCGACHSDASANPQAPFFSNQSNIDADAALVALESAYEAAKAKMDLDNPANSRLVIRVREEFHNCWTANCQTDAQEMENAIQEYAGNIEFLPIDESLIISKAMKMGDAMIASSGIRHEDDVIALYEFKTGAGNTAYDTSGVTPALPLTLNTDVSWVLGFGVEMQSGGKAQGSVANSKKLSDFIKASGEYSIEAWVVPGNIVQNGTSIVTYSGGGDTRNFTMGQSQYNYDFRNSNNAAGLTTLSTADADEDLQATLQHVVMNFSPVAGKPSLGTAPLGRSIYVNGVFTGAIDEAADTYSEDIDDPEDEAAGGLLTAWNDTYAFALGNEPGGSTGTQWKGKIRMLAVHSRALTQAQISQNFEVGVGQKFFMLFSVADLVNVPDSYVLFTVEQFDNTSYLFNKPTYVNLNPEYTPAAPIVIKGMRIGINSKEAVAGQAFGNMDVVVDDDNFVAGVGQVLSPFGTIISVEKGPDADEFFLAFEQLGELTNELVEPVPSARTFPNDPAENISADIGMRTFDEINATMAATTGITTSINLTEASLNTLVQKETQYRTDVRNGNPATGLTLTEQLNKTYTFYRQQLPSVENIRGFLPSHQMAVAQLSVKYCDVLVETNPSYFQDEGNSIFAMTSGPATAFATAADRNKVMYPLLTSMMNVDAAKVLSNQPDKDQVSSLLTAAGTTAGFDADFPTLANSLIDEMMTETACFFFEGDQDLEASISCSSADRTKQIVKATCAAVLGSAAMLVQ